MAALNACISLSSLSLSLFIFFFFLFSGEEEEEEEEEEGRRKKEEGGRRVLHLVEGSGVATYVATGPGLHTTGYCTGTGTGTVQVQVQGQTSDRKYCTKYFEI